MTAGPETLAPACKRGAFIDGRIDHFAGYRAESLAADTRCCAIAASVLNGRRLCDDTDRIDAIIDELDAGILQG